MSDTGSGVIAQAANLSDFYYSFNDDEELVAPDLTRGSASSGVSSSSASNIDLEEMFRHDNNIAYPTRIAPPHSPTKDGNKRSSLGNLSFRVGRSLSPSPLMKATTKVSDPSRQESINENDINGSSKPKSLLSRISSFRRASSPTYDQSKGSRPSSPLSFLLSRSPPHSPEHPNPNRAHKREHPHLPRQIQIEFKPAHSPSPNACTPASAGTRTPTSGQGRGTNTSEYPAENLAKLTTDGSSSVPAPATLPPITSNPNPTPTSNVPTDCHTPSNTVPWHRTPIPIPRETPSPFLTSSLPDLDGERPSWVSDAPPPRTHSFTGSSAKADGAHGRRVSLDSSTPSRSKSLPVAERRYWFRCTHRENPAPTTGTTATSTSQRTTATTDTDAGGPPRSSPFVTALQHSTILESLLQYLTWVEFNALADANHAIRKLFDPDDPILGGDLRKCEQRERRRVKEVVLRQYVPGYNPSWLSSPPVHRHREEEPEEDGADLEGEEEEIHVSMMDLDVLVQSQQIPLTVYPTQALLSLTSSSSLTCGITTKAVPQLQCSTSSPTRRPMRIARTPSNNSTSQTPHGGGDQHANNNNNDVEVTGELARTTMAHSKFVAFLRHRALRYRMDYQKQESQQPGSRDTVNEFDWRSLYAPIRPPSQPSDSPAPHHDAGLPPGTGNVRGAGASTRGLELKFPAPLSYFAPAAERGPLTGAPENTRGKMAKAGAVTGRPEPPTSPGRPSSPSYPPRRLSYLTSLPNQPPSRPQSPSLESTSASPPTITQKLKTTLTHLSGAKPRTPLPPPKPTQDPSVAWHRASRYQHHLRTGSLGNGNIRRTDSRSSYYAGGGWAELGYYAGSAGTSGRSTPGSGYRARHGRSGSLPCASTFVAQATRASDIVMDTQTKVDEGPSSFVSEPPARSSSSSFSFELVEFHPTTPGPSSGPMPVTQQNLARPGTPPLDVFDERPPSLAPDRGSIAENDHSGSSYASVLNNPHSLQAASNPYFAPVYRVYVPTSTSPFDPATIAECEAQLGVAGVWERWVQVGDIVVNLGYVPTSSPASRDVGPTSTPESAPNTSEDADGLSWMVYNGRGLVRFDPKDPPLPSRPTPQARELPINTNSNPLITTTSTLADDAIVAGVPCPTYYAHVLPKGMNPIWPLSIPVHLLPPPPRSSPAPPTPYPSGAATAATCAGGVVSYWVSTGALQFALIQVAKYLPSHLGRVCVQRFTWTARCDFSQASEGVHELGLWVGKWVLEAEGTPEGRAALEKVLEENYRSKYAHRGASAWKWEVVLERCEGSTLWLRYVIRPK